MTKEQKDGMRVEWGSDYIHQGARFPIVNRKGDFLGQIEILSEPEVKCCPEDGYVTIILKGGCIGADGQPISNVKLEVDPWYSSDEMEQDLYNAIYSFSFIISQTLSILKEDSRLQEFFYKVQNIRNSIFFHYILVERKLSVLYPSYLARIRRIASILDEGFEAVFNMFKGISDDIIIPFQHAFEMIEGLRKELYKLPY